MQACQWAPQVLSELTGRARVQARQDFTQMKTMAGSASRKLSTMAQSLLRDLQGP